MQQVRLCGSGKLDCDIQTIGTKIILVTFNEPVTIKEGQELEIILNESKENDS